MAQMMNIILNHESMQTMWTQMAWPGRDATAVSSLQELQMDRAEAIYLAEDSGSAATSGRIGKGIETMTISEKYSRIRAIEHELDNLEETLACKMSIAQRRRYEAYANKLQAQIDRLDDSILDNEQP